MTMSLNAAVWIALALLGFFALYVLIERILFLLFRRLADELALNSWLAECRRQRAVPLRTSSGWLGWLDRPLIRSRGTATDLWELCSWERCEVERYQYALPVVASVATALGLLGTFLALKENAVGAADPTQVIALGIGTSIVGLIIAIVCTFVDWPIRQRIARLRFQTAVVLETLEEILTPLPPSPATTTTANPSADNSADEDIAIRCLMDDLADSEATAPTATPHRSNGKLTAPARKPVKSVFSTRRENCP